MSLAARRRRWSLTRVLSFAAIGLLSLTARAGWIEFLDETATRATVDPALFQNDTDEKDYAWGDLDKDGDIDLVIVRKEGWTTSGKRPNLLLLNEGGVLVDRTAQYAAESDVPGDMGFLTPTNDRDVQLVDVDNDSWLDVVTATTISDGEPKHIGHPRVYMNKGEDAGGNWLGLRHEDGRMPALLTHGGIAGHNPRFCSVAAGDLDGDGFADLYFSDYDTSAFGPPEPGGADFEDKLLYNDGSGHFVDVTATRFGANLDGRPFEVSDFGASSRIADMNGDGRNDIVKQTSLVFPFLVGVTYNDPDNEGFFDVAHAVNQNAPYFISIGDLNNDGRQDMVISDDGIDLYLLNTGNDNLGRAIFLPQAFSFESTFDDGFGNNSIIEDLNNDGWNDVIVAGMDVDSPNCNFNTHFYRNLGGSGPGAIVTLFEESEGSNCQNTTGNPDCLIGGIPTEDLEGVFDMAVFDIDGDGWKDMVLGHCSGSHVYMNQPPAPGLRFSYPLGLPLFVAAGQTFSFQVQIEGFDGALFQPGSEKMFASLSGGPFNEVPLTALGGGLFEGALPASTSCAEEIGFYFSADDRNGGGTFSDPADSPGDFHKAIAAFGTETVLEDDVEGDVSAWTVVNDPSLAGGGWEQAIPNGTLTGGGEQAAPNEDGESAETQVKAFVTENGAGGAAAALSDVDGGPTDLISPPFDFDGTDGLVSYTRWFFTDGDDALTVAVSNDGNSWVTVETVTNGTGDWQNASFRVGDYIVPNATVQVRFRTSDSGNDSITEAGVDRFRVERFACTPCTTGADCDDGVWCSGAESCSNGFCLPGSAPCPGQICDEGNDVCVECIVDADCDDGTHCNGLESCASNVCVAGTDPCPGQQCDEFGNVCADCLVDADCGDGVFCNGAELCSAGSCSAAPDACPGQLCDEGADACIGPVPRQPRMGEPLLGLTPGELTRFEAGKAAFQSVFSEAMGLGPTFNENSCATCHSNPLGGSGSILVTRFGFNDDKGGGFDPLQNLGGSLLQVDALDPQCFETVPIEANVTAQRLTNSTLGFGLVEAIADADIQAAEITPPAGVSGRAHLVEPLEAPGATRVGRFGWKSQVATVLSFSGDAALNEMGITNRLVGVENAPNGDLVLLSQCDTQPDPEDGPDPQGFAFIDRVTDFQRFLAPPPQTPKSGMAGEFHFSTLGCVSCHQPQFTTADDPSLESALRNKTLKPYSDFLLHDIGQNADFIEQGDATVRELRTPPLWGLRVRDPMWHDGRVAGGTFHGRVTAAIGEHDSLGSEAQASAQLFAIQPAGVQDALIDFLDSLGRAEFDHDGDNDVDGDDWVEFQLCLAGGGPYGADDPCALSDVDRDGDVDDDDYDVFVSAFAGQFGGDVSDLRVDPAAGSQLELSWSGSCAVSDDDFEIYEGTLGNFTSHRSVLCSTVGATSATISPQPGDRYYLVVPSNGLREGSYGLDGSGVERPQAVGAFACRERFTTPCPD